MNLKHYRITPLIITILLLSAGLDLCITRWLEPWLVYHGVALLRAPSNAALVVMFLGLYDRMLWKLPVFKLLLNVPDISGRYEGIVSYEWDNKPGQKKCSIEVTQTASKIKIRSYFSNEDGQKSISRSLVEEIVQEDDNYFGLYYLYLNEGSKKNSDLDCHEGANRLRFLPGDKNNPAKLTGHYFTNRLKQTKGEIETSFVSKKIKGEL